MNGRPTSAATTPSTPKDPARNPADPSPNPANNPGDPCVQPSPDPNRKGDI